MKSIDIHAHLVPKSLWQAADAGREWYGFRHGYHLDAAQGRPWHPSPVSWVQGLESLTQEEKDRILWRNLQSLLKL